MRKCWISALFLVSFGALQIISCISSANLRILCFILVQPYNPDSVDRASVIQHTWGAHCSKLVFISTKPLSELSPADFEVITAKLNEDRINLYPKIFFSWKQIHAKYRNDADVFFKADDDTFLIVPNLKQYVQDSNLTLDQPWFIGNSYHHPDFYDRSFASGGPGYGINRVALDLFAGAAESGLCSAIPGPEDVNFADCMYNVGVKLTMSIDKEGRDRFVHWSLEERFDTDSVQTAKWWFERSMNHEFGEKCCSPMLVSVHKLSATQLKTYYFIFYEARRNFTIIDSKTPQT